MRNSWQDFSHEVKLHKNRYVRIAFIVCGTLSFILGIVGIFLPVLPTTPFLLLSAYLYAKSSARFYNWMLNNRIFGKAIQEWHRDKSLPLKTKIVAISTLIITLGTSIFLFVPLVPVKILLALVGLAVAIYILRIPTRKEQKQ